MSKSESELVHRFAGNLSRLRKARGLSQEELAHRAGIDRTFVSGCERLVRNPTLTTVEKIAAGLEVDPIELFKVTA
ncbi:helix-turn-helix transcriptional regulator [Tropicibacter sp. R15_0]|jgi:transcriptional regulator with XRE-family HTH domain|uniref:helix-turn-helix domain-containing protein n=1 Tax=Tropicibacter sp. R15_0 TaxID=2821101 RepID=UPI001ADAB225|nr:helix-turn-helix transcriptional regulator [Tropicibacter sp. R15_0]MBO9468402.1 helix-turn-helix transcriptional regulator [Tropicibacter sp. R15_0]